MLTGDPLRCPGCGAVHPGTERFCEACGLPLVVDRPSELALSRLKVRREFTEGDLVKVAGGRNQPEAEFIQGLLLEEGIPSMVRRSAGFDVPDMLAAGPRDVLVPASGARTARQVLLEADLLGATDGSGPPALKVLAGLLVGLAVLAVFALLLA